MSYETNPRSVYHDHACVNPHEVERLFFEAVDRGELEVFKTKISRDMIILMRIEYVYDLADMSRGINTFKIIAKLKQPISIPGKQDVNLPKISLVGAILDKEGNILNSEAHILQD